MCITITPYQDINDFAVFPPLKTSLASVVGTGLENEKRSDVWLQLRVVDPRFFRREFFRF